VRGNALTHAREDASENVKDKGRYSIDLMCNNVLCRPHSSMCLCFCVCLAVCLSASVFLCNKHVRMCLCTGVCDVCACVCLHSSVYTYTHNHVLGYMYVPPPYISAHSLSLPPFLPPCVTRSFNFACSCFYVALSTSRAAAQENSCDSNDHFLNHYCVYATHDVCMILMSSRTHFSFISSRK